MAKKRKPVPKKSSKGKKYKPKNFVVKAFDAVEEKQKTMPEKIGKFLGKIIVITILILVAYFGILIQQKNKLKAWQPPPIEIGQAESGVKAAWRNYGDEVMKCSKKYGLPPEYFLAVIMLESSGHKHPRPRFERYIYRRLKAVKDGKLKQFENITQKDLRFVSNRELKKLASSWGPFQIMGYKSLKMKIPVEKLSGKNAICYGMKWINEDYGWLLRSHRYKDAFHFHNTGNLYPKDGKAQTHTPNYVERGLYYMQIFRAIINKEQNKKKKKK